MKLINNIISYFKDQKMKTFKSYKQRMKTMIIEYQNGAEINEIAKHYGASYNGLYHALKSRKLLRKASVEQAPLEGVQLKSILYNDPSVFEELYIKYLDHHPMQALLLEYNWSVGSFYEEVKRQGLPKKDPDKKPKTPLEQIQIPEPLTRLKATQVPVPSPVSTVALPQAQIDKPSNTLNLGGYPVEIDNSFFPPKLVLRLSFSEM